MTFIGSDLTAAESSTDVAIALETSAPDPSTVKSDITVGTKKSFTGKIVAVLVDNGINANQTGMGQIQLRRVMRAYYPSIEGQAAEFGYSHGGGDSRIQRL